MNYFKDCKTPKERKAKYRELIKLHHLDAGGDEATMKEINKEYKEGVSFNSAYEEVEPTGAERASAYNFWSSPEWKENIKNNQDWVRSQTSSWRDGFNGRTQRENTEKYNEKYWEDYLNRNKWTYAEWQADFSEEAKQEREKRFAESAERFQESRKRAKDLLKLQRL